MFEHRTYDGSSSYTAIIGIAERIALADDERIDSETRESARDFLRGEFDNWKRGAGVEEEPEDEEPPFD